MKKRIRVLIVDDSALMRKKISGMISDSPDLEVIAVARDGYEALNITQTLKPDVIVLDLQLPNMDGLTCLAYIMSEWPTPVIVLSAFSPEGSENAITAYEYGAVDIMTKPGGAISLNIETIQQELQAKIRVANLVTPEKLKPLALKTIKPHNAIRNITLNKIIAIGASTGGPSALTKVLSNLPNNICAGILVIQHMPNHFIKSFAKRLNHQTNLSVKEAEDGDLIQPATVLIAPYGFEMLVAKAKKSEHVILKKEENKLHHLSPSIDKTFFSVGEVFGNQAIGVLLTGMGKDGTEGFKNIKRHGGTTIAEDESTSVVYGMPAAAAAAGVVDHLLPLDKIAAAILKQVGYKNGK